MKLQADNGSDEEQFSSDQNSKQTYSGRVTFGLKNPSVIGLDSFKLSYSHDWNRPAAPPGEQNSNVIYTGMELSKGPVMFRAEHQDGYFALEDFTAGFPPGACLANITPACPYVEEQLDLYYGTLYFDVTSDLTSYARYESQQFGQVLGYLDHSSYTLGMNYNLDVLTLKGEYHKQTYDGNIPRTGPLGTTYDEDNQVRLQAVASF